MLSQDDSNIMASVGRNDASNGLERALGRWAPSSRRFRYKRYKRKTLTETVDGSVELIAFVLLVSFGGGAGL